MINYDIHYLILLSRILLYNLVVNCLFSILFLSPKRDNNKRTLEHVCEFYYFNFLYIYFRNWENKVIYKVFFQSRQLLSFLYVEFWLMSLLCVCFTHQLLVHALVPKSQYRVETCKMLVGRLHFLLTIAPVMTPMTVPAHTWLEVSGIVFSFTFVQLRSQNILTAGA